MDPGRGVTTRFDSWIVLSLVAATSGLAWLGLRAYVDGYFYNDGFRYYSALRNLVDGLGSYEGPTFEHWLGKHAYLTLPALAPLVALFRDPRVLLIVALLAWAWGGWLAAAPLEGRPAWLRRGFVMAWLIYPPVLAGVYGWYRLFQPDLLAVPALWLVFLAFIRKQALVFFLAGAWVIATKEENLLWMLLLSFWLWIWERVEHGRWPFSPKASLAGFAAWFALGVFSVWVFRHYAALNVLATPLPAETDLGRVLEFHLLFSEVVPQWLRLGLPVAIGGLLLGLGRDWAWWAGGWLLIVAARLTADLVLYGRVLEDLIAHMHALLGGLAFGSLAVAYTRSAERAGAFRSALALAFLAYPGVQALKHQHAVGLARAYVRGHAQPAADFRELQSLAISLPAPKAKETILLEGFYTWPFAERSAAELTWWRNLSGTQREILNERLDWVLFEKHARPRADSNRELHPLSEAELRSIPRLEIFKETQNFILFKRSREQ